MLSYEFNKIEYKNYYGLESILNIFYGGESGLSVVLKSYWIGVMVSIGSRISVTSL